MERFTGEVVCDDIAEIVFPDDIEGSEDVGVVGELEGADFVLEEVAGDFVVDVFHVNGFDGYLFVGSGVLA